VLKPSGRSAPKPQIASLHNSPDSDNFFATCGHIRVQLEKKWVTGDAFIDNRNPKPLASTRVPSLNSALFSSRFGPLPHALHLSRVSALIISGVKPLVTLI